MPARAISTRRLAWQHRRMKIQDEANDKIQTAENALFCLRTPKNGTPNDLLFPRFIRWLPDCNMLEFSRCDRSSYARIARRAGGRNRDIIGSVNRALGYVHTHVMPGSHCRFLCDPIAVVLLPIAPAERAGGDRKKVLRNSNMLEFSRCDRCSYARIARRSGGRNRDKIGRVNRA